MKRTFLALFFGLFTFYVFATDPTQPSAIDTTIEAVDAAAADTSVVIVPPSGNPTVDWVFDEKNGIFALLLLLVMYLSSYIPGLQNIDDKRKRALVAGIILGTGIVVWRIFDKELEASSFISLAFTFISTQLTYIFGLKPMSLKTPDKAKIQ